MKITAVRFEQLTGTMEHPGVFWEDRLGRPTDVYPEGRAEGPRSLPQVGDGRYRIESVFLEIETDEGVTGRAGPISGPLAMVIDLFYKRALLGQDPLASERIWDKLYRSAVAGRKGMTIAGISAVDNALWDLKGKWLQLPVYRLLGGPTREEIPVYVSTLGYSLELDLVRQRAKAFAEQGYTAMKWFFKYGPYHGREGMRENVRLVQTIREAVGPDVDIMLDLWMSWDVPYTLEMAERLKEFRPRWFEEPVLPDKVDSCAAIRRAISIPIATGEHEYTRWGIKSLIDAGAADVLQPDIYWVGGLSEMNKIAALASASDLLVIPHGHSVPASIQFYASQSPAVSPILEYLDKWNQIHQFFLRNPPRPRNGLLTLPEEPGMNMELDETKIESRKELAWS
jgi:L-alanine-DL-glutamate epimerase-like enolase superfamily enzyme